MRRGDDTLHLADQVEHHTEFICLRLCDFAPVQLGELRTDLVKITSAILVEFGDHAVSLGGGVIDPPLAQSVFLSLTYHVVSPVVVGYYIFQSVSDS